MLRAHCMSNGCGLHHIHCFVRVSPIRMAPAVIRNVTVYLGVAEEMHPKSHQSYRVVKTSDLVPQAVRQSCFWGQLDGWSEL